MSLDKTSATRRRVRAFIKSPIKDMYLMPSDLITF